MANANFGGGAADVNVGGRLTAMAARVPNQVAVVEPLERDAMGRRRYRSLTFRELDDDSDRIAAGLDAIGVRPGMRLVLLVRPGIDFISLVFALFKAGVVTILVDPGLGRSNMLSCLEESRPDGFIAIPLAQAVRRFYGGRFPQARFDVTVGRRVLGWTDAGKPSSESDAELSAGRCDGGRSGRHHFHDRQHGAGERGALSTRQLLPAGRRNPIAVRHSAR